VDEDINTPALLEGKPSWEYLKTDTPAADYQALIEELEVLRDIYVSEREVVEGKGVPHEQVARELRELLRSRLAK
jgi:hypothetical protein